MTTPAAEQITTSLVTMLATAIGQGIPWGDNSAPTLVPNKPYGIVYDIPGGNTWGSLALPDADGSAHVQVSYISTLPASARWLRDLGRATILARTFAGNHQVSWPTMTNGLTVINRTLTEWGGCITSGDPPKQFFAYMDRYSIDVCPS